MVIEIYQYQNRWLLRPNIRVQPTAELLTQLIDESSEPTVSNTG